MKTKGYFLEIEGNNKTLKQWGLTSKEVIGKRYGFELVGKERDADSKNIIYRFKLVPLYDFAGSTNPNEKLEITCAGNVGIGT